MSTPLNATLALVTQRITERSAGPRADYLNTMAANAKAGTQRAGMGCANMAHTTAALPTADKLSLARALVAEVVQEMAPETAGRDVDWHIAELPVVTGDRAMLRMVLVNLISNALKFTQKRERAEITIGSLPDQAAETVVFVRDNGAGFDSTKAARLFTPFHRLHTAAEFVGTGVGLATAHSRMEGLRRQCATQIVMLDGEELGFSVAMGVASFPHTAHGHDEHHGSVLSHVKPYLIVGAALFVDIAMRFHAIYGGSPSPLHVVAYVVAIVKTGFVVARVDAGNAVFVAIARVGSINKSVLTPVAGHHQKSGHAKRDNEHNHGSLDANKAHNRHQQKERKLAHQYIAHPLTALFADKVL